MMIEFLALNFESVFHFLKESFDIAEYFLCRLFFLILLVIGLVAVIREHKKK
jgi:hypothetical protein